jgi:hypothetical protein
MRFKASMLVLFCIALTSSVSLAQTLGFTQQDVDLVKSACLAGDAYEVSLKGDGSISVKSLEAKGELIADKTHVVIVSVPDADKKSEFDSIRTCIKDYLLGGHPQQPTQTTVTYKVCEGEYESNCQPHDGYVYCYESVENWAKQRCEKYKVNPRAINTKGGNKCGYSIYQVVCTMAQ